MQSSVVVADRSYTFLLLTRWCSYIRTPKGETLFTHPIKEVGCVGMDEQKITVQNRRVRDEEGHGNSLQVRKVLSKQTK